MPIGDLEPMTSSFYKDVPMEGIERLLAFREQYPYQVMTINKFDWHFIDTGGEGHPLLLFAGGTTIAEVSINSIERLAKSYRVIAPDYPPIDKLKELFTGFIELLDRLSLQQVYAMGGSYGGWMLQSFIRAYPERVRKAVISVVGPPNPENSDQIAKILPLVRILPMYMLRSLLNRLFTGLESERTENPDQIMIWALVKEAVYHRVQRKGFVALMKRLIDQTRNYAFTANDLADWEGKLLMLFGSDDPATPPERREAMRQLYPDADLEVIEGGQHGISMTHEAEYYGTIEKFLGN